MTHLEVKSLIIGALIGIIAGLILGYVIWRRYRAGGDALNDLKWSQLFAAVLALIALLIEASDAITIALITTITAESVGLSIVRRVNKQ